MRGADRGNSAHDCIARKYELSSIEFVNLSEPTEWKMSVVARCRILGIGLLYWRRLNIVVIVANEIYLRTKII